MRGEEAKALDVKRMMLNFWSVVNVEFICIVRRINYKRIITSRSEYKEILTHHLHDLGHGSENLNCFKTFS